MKKYIMFAFCFMAIMGLCACDKKQENVTTEASTIATEEVQETEEVTTETDQTSATELSTTELTTEATEDDLEASIDDLLKVMKEQELNYIEDVIGMSLYQCIKAQENATDFQGEWNRTNVVRAQDCALNITNQTTEGFSFELDSQYYSHSGIIEGMAYFVTDKVAVYEYYNEYVEEESDQYKYVIFERTEAGITIYSSAHNLGMGANCSVVGDYITGEPNYLNANVLADNFTEEELGIIRSMFGDSIYNDSFLFIVEEGHMDCADCVLADGTKAVFYDAFVPTMGMYYFRMLKCEDGRIYCEMGEELGWFTTEPGEIDYPEYELVEE